MAIKINKRNKIASDKSQKVVFGIYFVLFIIFSFLCLYPIIWCFMNSLKTTEEFAFNPNGLPEAFNIHFYNEIFTSFKVGKAGFWTMTFNTFWLACGGQALNILASMMVAYPLARYKTPYNKFFYGIIIFRITIPVIGAGPAAYKLMRSLNMVNNPPVYMITFFSGFDMAALIMYGYFKNVSRGYSDAAYIDGATLLQTFVYVIFPQAFPCALALYVSNVMSQWSNYSTPLIYLPKYPTLAFGVYEIDQGAAFLGTNGEAKKYGAIILSAIVPLVLFGASQKLMIQNMSVGGLKG